MRNSCTIQDAHIESAQYRAAPRIIPQEYNWITLETQADRGRVG